MEARPVPVAHARTAIICGTVAFGMLGLAFASVPLYDLFCRVTGFGGTPMVGTGPAARVLDQTVTVRFDANVAPGLGLRFTPEVPAVKVRIGETHEVRYTIRNEGTREVTAVATFNVTPERSGPYFTKLECFCFTDRTIKPGETQEAQVVFYVDPAIADDRDTKDINTITLSYTFFPSKPKPVAAVAGSEPKL